MDYIEFLEYCKTAIHPSWNSYMDEEESREYILLLKSIENLLKKERGRKYSWHRNWAEASNDLWKMHYHAMCE